MKSVLVFWLCWYERLLLLLMMGLLVVIQVLVLRGMVLGRDGWCKGCDEGC